MRTSTYQLKSLYIRDVVSVSTSRDAFFKRLGLVSVSELKVSFTSDIFHTVEHEILTQYQGHHPFLGKFVDVWNVDFILFYILESISLD